MDWWWSYIIAFPFRVDYTNLCQSEAHAHPSFNSFMKKTKPVNHISNSCLAL